MPTKYRIALLVDDVQVPSWVRDLAVFASSHSTIELAAILAVRPSAGRLDRLMEIEQRFLSKSKDYRRYQQLHAIADLAPVQMRLGSSAEPSADEIRDLKALESRCSCALREGVTIRGDC